MIRQIINLSLPPGREMLLQRFPGIWDVQTASSREIITESFQVILIIALALHPAGTISGNQVLDLLYGDMIEIANNGLLETGGGCGKIYGFLRRIAL